MNWTDSTLGEELKEIRESNERLRREAAVRDYTIGVLTDRVEMISAHLEQLIRRPAAIPRPDTTQGVNHD